MCEFGRTRSNEFMSALESTYDMFVSHLVISHRHLVIMI